MKQHLCRVVENRALWSKVQLLVVQAPELAAIGPGQMALARDPTSFDPYLRHKLWMYSTGERISFTLSSHDKLVPQARVDSLLNLLAPVGRVIEFNPTARHILLLGENDLVAPLIPIAQSAINQGCAVVLGLHVDPTTPPMPAYLLPPEVEYRLDGDVSTELYEWADHILASGSEVFYSRITRMVRTVRYRFERGWARVLLDPILPCGMGTCYACATDTSQGIRLACTDGPAFDLRDLETREGMMNPFLEEQAQRVMEVTQAAGGHLLRLPGASVIEKTLHAYSQDRASILAAALSYYTILSLFPVMLFILAMTSPFLQSESAIRAVTSFVGLYLPEGRSLLQTSLEEVTRLRGPLTIVAAGGFLWSASGVFDLIQLGINRAFRVQQPRPLWRQRIVSLAMVIVVSLLFGLSFLWTTLLRLAVHYGILERHNNLVDYGSPIGAILVGILIFGSLYRYIPFDPNIRWRDVLVSAIIASSLWELAKLGFAWYITNLAVLNLVYGSVGAIIAVMLWGYITAVIMLMCAELAGVLAGAHERKRTGNEWWSPNEPGSTSTWQGSRPLDHGNS